LEFDDFCILTRFSEVTFVTAIATLMKVTETLLVISVDFLGKS